MTKPSPGVGARASSVTRQGPQDMNTDLFGNANVILDIPAEAECNRAEGFEHARRTKFSNTGGLYSSSYATNHVLAKESIEPCPTPRIFADMHGAHTVRCESLQCESCQRWKCYVLAMAIALQEPTQELLFEKIGHDSDPDLARNVMRRMNRLMQYMKQQGYPLGAFFWCCERGKGGMIHVHLAVRGPEINSEALIRAARWASAGTVNIGPLFNVGGFGWYITKGYREDPDEFIRLNGKHLGHASRKAQNFWRVGGTKDGAVAIVQAQYRGSLNRRVDILRKRIGNHRVVVGHNPRNKLRPMSKSARYSVHRDSCSCRILL
jgi:hypothetical protein